MGLLAQGAVALGVDVALRLGACADTACGGFDRVRPEVVGTVLLALEALRRLICRRRRRDGDGETPRAPRSIEVAAPEEDRDGVAAGTVEPSEDEPGIVAPDRPPAEADPSRSRPPSPSRIIAAAHRVDAIVVPLGWSAPVATGEIFGKGDCGGFDPKAPIILDNGALSVPSPCPSGGGEGCRCSALDLWVARARRSLE